MLLLCLVASVDLLVLGVLDDGNPRGCLAIVVGSWLWWLLLLLLRLLLLLIAGCWARRLLLVVIVILRPGVDDQHKSECQDLKKCTNVVSRADLESTTPTTLTIAFIFEIASLERLLRKKDWDCRKIVCRWHLYKIFLFISSIHALRWRRSSGERCREPRAICTHIFRAQKKALQSSCVCKKCRARHGKPFVMWL